MPFAATIGSATVSPDHVDSTPTDDGSFDVTFTSGIDLDGLAADAFGLSQPEVTPRRRTRTTRTTRARRA